jgi:hypothetical protein
MENEVDVVSDGDVTTTTYDDPWSTYSTTVLERATLTIIDGDGNGPVVTFPNTIAVPTTLDGFIIQNIDDTSTDLPLVSIDSGGTNPVVTNCIIRDNQGLGTSGGIGLAGNGVSASPSIQANFIHNVNWPGVGNESNSSATIKNNEIWDCNGPGIGLQVNAGPTIGGPAEGNYIFQNALGIGAPNGLDATNGPISIVIQGNTLENNGQAAIRLYRDSADVSAKSIDVTMGGDTANHGNEISNHGGLEPAVVLHDLTTAIIRHNTLQNNTNRVGVFLSSDVATGVMTAVLERNTFQSCQRAVCIVGACLTTIGGALDAGGGFTEANIFDNNAVAGIVFGSGAVGPFTPGPSSQNVTIQGNDMFDNGGPTGAAIVVGDSTGLAGNIAGSITVDQNRIENNHAGIRVMDPCTSLTITRNNIHANLMAGVAAGDVSSRDCAGTGCANLTVTQNKIHNNGSGGAAGCNMIDASGDVINNLFYGNSYAGLVFGELVDSIINNTSVYQTGYTADGGAGIKYYKLSDTGINCENLAGSGGSIPDPPAIDIRNNILAYNATAGFGKCTSGPPGDCNAGNITARDYNLLYLNNETLTDCDWGLTPDDLYKFCVERNYGGCGATDVSPFQLLSANDKIADPSFVNAGIDNYRLQADSPAMTGGDPFYGSEMGAYGGGSPINDLEIPAD